MTGRRRAKTRSRSGCLNCRKRRRKCDGTQPSCRSCESRGDQCVWGLNVSFHPSRNLRLSSSDSAALAAVGQRTPARSVQIVDETEQTISEVHGEIQDFSSDEEAGSAPNAGGLGNVAPSSALNNARRDNALSSRLSEEHTAAHTPFSTQQDGSAQQDFSPIVFAEQYSPPFSLGRAISQHAPPPPEPAIPTTRAETLRLISMFLQETGTWCETTDSDMHFTVASIHIMMESQPFVAAAVALASRQLEAIGGQSHQTTLELYQHTLQLLIRRDPADVDESILATCTLLCVYEMMASDVSEWRRHLKGCAELLRTKKWNGSSRGIVNTCFWAFARIDVWAAFNTGQQTLIPTESWVDSENWSFLAGTIDDYCNLAILCFARIVNLMDEFRLSIRNVRSQDPTLVGKLWEYLQRWYANRPRKVLPLARMEREGNNPFPVVIYSQSSSICGHTFYHAGSILLLQSGFLQLCDSSTVPEIKDPIWHSRELGGIAASNTSHANWVNLLQPLYIAGLVFSGNGVKEFWDREERRPVVSAPRESLSFAGDEFAPEKIALLKQLARIERETGWKTSDRAAQLRRLWGLG